MEDKHRIILRNYRPNIVRDLEPRNILPKLGTVLTQNDDDEIKGQPTRLGRCEKLLEILPRKGPKAFKVFVEALKEEAAHLAQDLIEADKGTANELRHVRAQSANLRGENCDLKAKLQAEKQDHTRTSQQLKELNSLHETFKTKTSGQIQKLAEIVQQFIDDSCSSCEALNNLRDSTERENQTSEIQELTKEITNMMERYELNTKEQEKRYESLENEHRKESQELKKAQKLLKENYKYKKKALTLEKDLEKSEANLAETKENLTRENERVTDYQQKLEVNSKTIDDLHKKLKDTEQKLQECKENKSLQKKPSDERSSRDNLKKEVHRLRLALKKMPGPIYNYSKDFDKRGVVYDLVKKSGKTPQVNATRSSDGEGKAADLLKNQVKPGTVSGTEDKKDSWWRVDLSEKYELYLTHYTLRHGRNRSISVLVNWRLEGSLDGGKWTTLKNHENDCGLKEHLTYTWTIDANPNAFRYFRIFQTGKNSSDKFGIFLSGIELYGVLISKSS